MNIKKKLMTVTQQHQMDKVDMRITLHIMLKVFEVIYSIVD
jgi:hypothetical protein